MVSVLYLARLEGEEYGDVPFGTKAEVLTANHGISLIQ
jgi:hypothetical protein